MREYARRWAFKHPTPADFFRTVENVVGRGSLVVLAWLLLHERRARHRHRRRCNDLERRAEHREIQLRKHTSIPFPVEMRLKLSTMARRRTCGFRSTSGSSRQLHGDDPGAMRRSSACGCGRRERSRLELVERHLGERAARATRWVPSTAGGLVSSMIHNPRQYAIGAAKSAASRLGSGCGFPCAVDCESWLSSGWVSPPGRSLRRRYFAFHLRGQDAMPGFGNVGVSLVDAGAVRRSSPATSRTSASRSFCTARRRIAA